MKDFSIDEFRSAMNDFVHLKKMYPTYHFQEWKTNLSDDNSPSNQCKKVLERLKDLLEIVLTDLSVQNAKVYTCKGASYFPKVPWIGIIFEGETPTDGVYPVLSLYDDGFIVGCMESISRPQLNFASRCYSDEEIEKGRESGSQLFKYIDEHCSKKCQWFSFEKIQELTELQIEGAFQSAIDEYKDYKEHLRGKENWFVVKEIGDKDQFEEWLITMTHMKKALVFRGQGDSEWRLETGLGRSVFRDYPDDRNIDVDKIIGFEHESLLAFRREIARRPEYNNFSLVDLLALMQHYGSKTRLLDFTFSPLVALYMALEQYYEHTGQVKTFIRYHNQDVEGEVKAIAIWAVDIDELKTPDGKGLGKSKRQKVNKQEFIECDCNSAMFTHRRFVSFHDDADTILRTDTSKDVSLGVDVVVPSANNERCSAQEGLFLMPRKMSKSFERNLCWAFRDSSTSSLRHVTKYVFPVELVNQIQCCLDRFCITAKLIYPDLTGLAKSLNKKVDFSSEEWRGETFST